MFIFIKRALAAAIVIAAVALPTAAYARTTEPRSAPAYRWRRRIGPARPVPTSLPPRPPRAFSGAMPGSGPGACWC